MPGRVALAPIAGFTDYPFRAAVARYGCAYAVTPLSSAEGLARRGAAREPNLATGPDDAAVVAAQIFGARPATLAEAARRLADAGFAVVDLNLGCPVRRMRRQQAGAYLVEDAAAVRDVARAVVAASPVPVTAKLRLGFAAPTTSGLTAARILAAEGVAALAVHGRTVAQGFAGPVDYDGLAAVVAAVDIPVWANGGVRSPADAAAMLARTGAAGVMVGRGAVGRPYVINQLERYLATGTAPPAPTRAELAAVIAAQLARLVALVGEERAARQFRKHLLAYLKENGAPKELRLRAVAVEGSADVAAVLAAWQAAGGDEKGAP